MKTMGDHKRAVQHVSFLFDHNHPGFTLDPDSPSAKVNLIPHLYKNKYYSLLVFSVSGWVQHKSTFPWTFSSRSWGKSSCASSHFELYVLHLYTTGKRKHWIWRWWHSEWSPTQRHTGKMFYMYSVLWHGFNKSHFLQTLTQGLAQIPTKEKVSGTDVITVVSQ